MSNVLRYLWALVILLVASLATAGTPDFQGVAEIPSGWDTVAVDSSPEDAERHEAPGQPTSPGESDSPELEDEAKDAFVLAGQPVCGSGLPSTELARSARGALPGQASERPPYRPPRS